MTVNVYPVVYSAGAEGDIVWMINSGNYPNAIFFFPDTYERFYLSTATGTQNQAARPYNLFGMYANQPLTAGIPINSEVFGGYTSLSQVGAQDSIDRAFSYATLVMETSGATNVYFSANPSGTSDPPVFDNLGDSTIGSDVIAYITSNLYALGTYTPPP